MKSRKEFVCWLITHSQRLIKRTFTHSQRLIKRTLTHSQRLIKRTLTHSQRLIKRTLAHSQRLIKRTLAHSQRLIKRTLVFEIRKRPIYLLASLFRIADKKIIFCPATLIYIQKVNLKLMIQIPVHIILFLNKF